MKRWNGRVIKRGASRGLRTLKTRVVNYARQRLHRMLGDVTPQLPRPFPPPFQPDEEKRAANIKLNAGFRLILAVSGLKR